MDTSSCREKTPLIRRAGPAAAMGLLCALFYWDALWLPAHRSIAGHDLTNMFVPWLHFAASSLRQGRFPLWNPYLFSGVSFVANPQPALFYPPNWLALLLPPTRALGVSIALHTWLAGVGMYAWLRSEGARRAGAFFGGVVFAFSGYTCVRIEAGHVGVLAVGAWLPLILWAYRRAAATRSLKWALLGGLPVGLAILAGHTATFIYVALTLAAYAAFQTWREARARPALLAGVMLLTGIGLAAVQLLPLAEFSLHATRGHADYNFAARFSWPPGYLLTMLIPNFFGEPARTGYWGDGVYEEFIYYVGVLPLLLTLLGLRQRRRLTFFLFALGLGALLLAIGPSGALHPLLYRFVPLFRVMRAPARAGFLFTLAAAALSGLTVSALLEDDGARARLLTPLGYRPTAAVAGLTLALILADFAAFAWGRETQPAAGRLWHQANQAVLFLLFFLLSAGLLAGWRDAPRHGRMWATLAFGLTVLDLWGFGAGRIAVQDALQSAYWRIVGQAVAGREDGRVLPWGLSEFDQNGGLSFGLRSVFGYDPLLLQPYRTFVDSRPDPRARTYDLLNARYLVTTAPQNFPAGPDAPILLHEEAGVWIYERPHALPRAWIASRIEVMDDAQVLARIHEPDFDPHTTALMSVQPDCRTAASDPGDADVIGFRDEGNRITAQVRGTGGVLIFSEIDYPGWRAALDGAPAPLLRADYLLRAVCVPPGEHQVELTYDPPLLKIGLAITLLTLLALLIVPLVPLVPLRGVA